MRGKNELHSYNTFRVLHGISIQLESSNWAYEVGRQEPGSYAGEFALCGCHKI